MQEGRGQLAFYYQVPKVFNDVSLSVDFGDFWNFGWLIH